MKIDEELLALMHTLSDEEQATLENLIAVPADPEAEQRIQARVMAQVSQQM